MKKGETKKGIESYLGSFWFSGKMDKEKLMKDYTKKKEELNAKELV